MGTGWWIRIGKTWVCQGRVAPLPPSVHLKIAPLGILLCNRHFCAKKAAIGMGVSYPG